MLFNDLYIINKVNYMNINQKYIKAVNISYIFCEKMKFLPPLVVYLDRLLIPSKSFLPLLN